MSRIDPSALLRIDLEAGLARLGEDLYQGPWQMPAELVRLATERGATRVVVSMHRRGFDVESDQEHLGPEVLADLAPLQPPLARLRRSASDPGALGRLERGGVSALVALFSQAATVHVDQSHGTWIGTTFRRGWDARRAREHLLGACRFTPAEIVVDGRPAPRRGFRESIALTQVEDPLPATISIPRTGATPRLWLLRHGVIAARATLPGAPCFQAAVEMAAISTETDHEADMVTRLDPHVPELIDRTLGFLIERAVALAGAPSEAASRIRTLLIEAATLGFRTAEIEPLSIFPGFRDGAPAIWSIEGLRAALDAGGPRLLRTGSLPAGRAPQVDVSAEERSRLAALLPAELAPTAAAAPPRLLDRLRAYGIARGLARLRPFGRMLRGEELGLAERALVEAVRGAADVDLLLHAGAGEPRLGRGTIRAGRDHATVRAATRALSRGPEWIYPIALALTNGKVGLGAAHRESWMRATQR
ncbi:MAG: hypothetical protein U0166_17015 [Acidobacteriota bacterium]